jgi:hypothetical protein
MEQDLKDKDREVESIIRGQKEIGREKASLIDALKV